MEKLCDKTLENNISSSPDDTQPVKKMVDLDKNQPSGGGKRMELMMVDQLIQNISKKIWLLEFLALTVECKSRVVMYQDIKRQSHVNSEHFKIC